MSNNTYSLPEPMRAVRIPMKSMYAAEAAATTSVLRDMQRRAVEDLTRKIDEDMTMWHGTPEQKAAVEAARKARADEAERAEADRRVERAAKDAERRAACLGPHRHLHTANVQVDISWEDNPSAEVSCCGGWSLTIEDNGWGYRQVTDLDAIYLHFHAHRAGWDDTTLNTALELAATPMAAHDVIRQIEATH